MSVGILFLLILAIAAIGFFAGRIRALSMVGGHPRQLHSLPSYYGQSVLIFAAVPAIFVLLVWLLAQPVIIETGVRQMISTGPDSTAQQQSLVMADVHRIAGGLDALMAKGNMTEADLDTMTASNTDIRSRLGEVGVALGAAVETDVFTAAKELRRQTTTGRWAMSWVVLGVALTGAGLSWLRISPEMRARNVTETSVKALLIAASMIAILTTVGIVMSLLFETLNFFQMYPAKDFFFNMVWNPQFRGGSDLGILPLLWGTLYVSFVALVFAVPVGLMAAIYLAEYAAKPVRAVAKPAIEILAGIPTIVYGLFALITVGPMLRDYFASPLGLGSSSSSVMTAGLVMGIMLIPFVSSLSDDVINAVPQAMRDGSFGLGATQSETVKQVILPAALPGIIGAILLAASRAIGETMIVVMGAGAAARLDLNPFQAMTTITVKIVSQLTGDTEFASPETLVAFALGLTLFVITLGLNVLALYVVRKYREQYE